MTIAQFWIESDGQAASFPIFFPAIVAWAVDLHGAQSHNNNSYGYTQLARQIRSDTLELVENAGFHEYFDPHTGTGYGTDTFSWTAALLIDILKKENLAPFFPATR